MIYKNPERLDLFEPQLSYGAIDDRRVIALMQLVRKGIEFTTFLNFADRSPFSLNEWADFLHLSGRSMQRYKKEKKTFDPLQSERILEIAMLYKKGIEVFNTSDKLDSWLNTENIALGNIKPKQLFDNSFGIHLLKDELTRIEYGVLA